MGDAYSRGVARVVGLGLGLLVAATACGLDETYTGMGNGAVPGDPLYPQATGSAACECAGGGAACPGDTAGGDVDHGALGVDDLTGLAWRFDSLVLAEPVKIAKLLNDMYFSSAIDKGELNVLLQAAQDDRAAGTLVLEVAPGTPADGKYTLDGAPSPLTCSLDGATFATTGAGTLSFPASLLKPPTLPIQRLRLSGRFAADASAISQGALEGVLTVADAEATKVLGMTMAAFFQSQGQPPDTDLDSDGVADAWRFSGAFTAAKVEVAP
jgi:hypothetical protein